MLFRNEYRIEETRYHDGSGNYVVQIKHWWFPFEWKTVSLSEWIYMFCDIDHAAYKSNDFMSRAGAEEFAERHSRIGWKAFFPNSTKYNYTFLGKLPKD